MKINPILILIAFLTLLSCQSQTDKFAPSSNKTGAERNQTTSKNKKQQAYPASTEQTQRPKGLQVEKGSKIIKTGSMTFEVKDILAVKQNINSLLSKADGYFEHENFHNFSNQASYKLKVRIPLNNYEQFVSGLESGIGKLTAKNLKADDVTEQYIDLQIRRDNALAYVQRYSELLNKAVTIEDVLEIQDEIRKLELEIESKTGRLKYLDDKVKYSTLDINLTEKTPVALAKINYGGRLVSAFKLGFRGLSEFILVVVQLWPFLF